MTLKRVTMQDIADACGLSRNTVSKVFNGRGSVPEPTRNLVVAKARELGYYQYTLDGVTREKQGGNIALLAQHKFLSHFFGTNFFTSFTNHVSQFGFTIQMYEVSSTELTKRELPPLLDIEQTAGIVGIELFDHSYIDMVCSLNIPTVFVDGYPHATMSPIPCDFVSMENTASEIAIVRRMISRGAQRLGFVGDIEHCNSFFERWQGFCIALGEAGITVDRHLCILEKDSDLYGDTDWLLEHLADMPTMPDAFVCANDFLAIHLMAALKAKGISMPEDVMVAGFGGGPEASIIQPTLTTAKIPSSEIGKLAAIVLSRRIQQPGFPFLLNYVQTTPIWGDSTC